MNLSTRIEGTLAAPLLAACRRLGEMASERGEHLYLVGGAVRDLVLERPFREIDLVLVGDVARLAREAGARSPGFSKWNASCSGEN